MCAVAVDASLQCEQELQRKEVLDEAEIQSTCGASNSHLMPEAAIELSFVL